MQFWESCLAGCASRERILTRRDSEERMLLAKSGEPFAGLVSALKLGESPAAAQDLAFPERARMVSIPGSQRFSLEGCGFKLRFADADQAVQGWRLRVVPAVIWAPGRSMRASEIAGAVPKSPSSQTEGIYPKP